MVEINFNNIRAHDGSKSNGFETLICQLAHLDKPPTAKRFVKKEGSGGDAGVECYWILEDESEICWQAKYFPEGMNSSRWQQLDESFSTALAKHPKLSHYVVCLPLDKSDSRKKGKGGKIVVSVEDEWNDRIEKWKKQAEDEGRQVGFSYWGKHEITQYLTIDDPVYTGKALYWFNETVLGQPALSEIVERSRKNLGDRYTPEFHVDLPIAKIFDGLCVNKPWFELLDKQKSEFKKNINDTLREITKEKLLPEDKVGLLKELGNEVVVSFEQVSLQNNYNDAIDLVQRKLDVITKSFDAVFNDISSKFDLYGDNKESGYILRKFSNFIEDTKYFLKQPKAIASLTKSLLVHGDAGIGKSHLLCDLSLHRINMGLPTVFLLGAHYGGVVGKRSKNFLPRKFDQFPMIDMGNPLDYSRGICKQL